MNSVAIISIMAGGLAAFLYFYLRSKKEWLTYLDMYDQQDHYKNRKTGGVPSWPVVNTATTALANIERRYIKEDKVFYDKNPRCIYSNIDRI